MSDEEYSIVSVEPTSPPRDMVGTDWHCYTIAQGNNTIRGYQQGKLKAVRESVESIVERLNERRFGKRGRVHLDMSASGAKSKKK